MRDRRTVGLQHAALKIDPILPGLKISRVHERFWFGFIEKPTGHELISSKDEIAE